jgi:hypothetical protein
LAHAEGVPADPAARGGGQPDLVEHLLDPAGGQPVAPCQGPEVGAGGAALVHVVGRQQRADVA